MKQSIRSLIVEELEASGAVTVRGSAGMMKVWKDPAAVLPWVTGDGKAFSCVDTAVGHVLDAVGIYLSYEVRKD